MTIVAQLYQPARPIAVGNRLHRINPRRSPSPRTFTPINSTFPSLVGSFGSRLEVGNCQPSRRFFAQRTTALHSASSCISTNTKLSSNRIRAVIGGLVLPFRVNTHHCATRGSVTHRYASQRITLPSVVGLRAECGGYLPPVAPLRFLQQCCATHHAATHLNEYLPSAGCLRATCGSQEPTSRRLAPPRQATPRTAHYLNCRPSGRYPQILHSKCFGMPSLVSPRPASLHCASHGVAIHRTVIT